MTRRELLLSLVAVPAALLVPVSQQGFSMAGIKDFPMFTARSLPTNAYFVWNEFHQRWDTKTKKPDNPY